MSFDAQAVQVHSVAEAYLYLLVTPCQSCGSGPLKQRGDLTKTSSVAGGWSLATACSACGVEGSIPFAIEPPPTREQARSDQINPTSARSGAIDLLGWLTLFQTILAESQRQEDKQAARQLAYEAAQCLDEALKFYDADNELPIEDAFFSEASRRRFHDHPQRFSRSTWRQRRLMLPDTKVAARLAGAKPRPPWWQFWRR